MADYPLLVFAKAEAPIPLIALRDVLVTEGLPANFGIDIAGEASDDELNTNGWDAAFLRWLEPEVHEVALIECLVRDRDEEADQLIGHDLDRIGRLSDVAGRMIVADHLNRTRSVYAVQLLPALLADDGHDAWGALDILLRFVAQAADGLIYAEAEGYCDADGELLLAETDDLYPVNVANLD